MGHPLPSRRLENLVGFNCELNFKCKAYILLTVAFMLKKSFPDPFQSPAGTTADDGSDEDSEETDDQVSFINVGRIPGEINTSNSSYSVSQPFRLTTNLR